MNRSFQAYNSRQLLVLAPAPSTFRRGRDFAAWVGVTLRQHSSGGKERLGHTTKMGERSLRRLLIIGASSAIIAAVRDGARDPWLAGLLARKPRLAGDGGAGQQDSEDRLGVHGPRRVLQGSDPGGVRGRCGPRRRGRGKVNRGGMAKGSVRRGSGKPG